MLEEDDEKTKKVKKYVFGLKKRKFNMREN